MLLQFNVAVLAWNLEELCLMKILNKCKDIFLLSVHPNAHYISRFTQSVEPITANNDDEK
ncbi:6731_t:CDS:2 [Dentiscutata erythropus]|uniref:6731_t:CDS:1 n=1 Tax=Dentiscutata erythropus TaxID=1348616 RepID=A0A9N9GQS7_9GLOM|nr:6731_t:CDS:2 [Dentiscutata erythropus]